MLLCLLVLLFVVIKPENPFASRPGRKGKPLAVYPLGPCILLLFSSWCFAATLLARHLLFYENPKILPSPPALGSKQNFKYLFLFFIFWF